MNVLNDADATAMAGCADSAANIVVVKIGATARVLCGQATSQLGTHATISDGGSA